MKTARVLAHPNGDVIKDTEGMPVVIEIDPEYSATLVEIPSGLSFDEFFKETSEIDIVEISKPYPNEHSCPHSASTKFDQFRRGTRNSNDKTYGVIYGKVRGTNRWEVVSFRYPKDTWGADTAKEHCKAHGGIAFEGAVSKTCEIEINEDAKECAVEIEIMKKDEDRHLVYGIILEPNVADLQKDFETEPEIEKAAHRFMFKMWSNPDSPTIGAQHEYPIEKAIPVESFIAPIDFWYEGTPQDDEHLVKKGSWVLVSLIADNDEFDKVKTGVYRGYSLQGHGKRK